MKNNLLNTVLESKFVIYIIFIFITLSIIFSRSFLGIYIFGFRIGEIFMAVSALTLFLSLFLRNYLSNKKISNLIMILQIIVVLFVFTSIITKSSFLNLYTYKASSYIWSVGFLIIGIIIPIKDNLIPHPIPAKKLIKIRCLYLNFFKNFNKK